MKLLYYDDVTPADYEPPFFRRCSESEAPSTWTKNPLKMEVGNVNSKHFVLALKVKSVLDPCEDENDGVAEDSGQDDEDDSSSDSEIRPSLADQFVAAPITTEKRSTECNETTSDAETEDVEYDEVQTARVKEWTVSRHTSTVDLADILSNFPDISVALAEGIMERLVKEGLLSKVGKDSYCIIKEEVEMQYVPPTEKMNRSTGEDYMYMKALYHALPMDYVTISKLQNMLDGEANQNTVRKLIDKMTHEGYLKNSGNKRLGKRVVHSESTNQKLLEVKKILEGQPMVNSTHEHNVNGSTCGGLHSFGSEMTRTQGRSEAYQNGSIQAQDQGNSPTSKVLPIASLESGVGKDGKGRVFFGGDGSHSTQDKQLRKSSMVKEPILQHIKRQKCQV